jgi:hypothetical protein
MKCIIDRILAMGTFLVVFFLHIYFALLLTARPAMAQETTEEPAKVEAAQASSAPAAKVPNPPKPPKIDLDKDINIQLDMKNGLTIKGVDKVIEKAKELEKWEAENESAMDADGADHDHHHGHGERVRKKYNFRIGPDGDAGPVALLVPLGFFAMIFGIVFLVISSKNKARREYLETVRLMVEKGQPIPENLMQNLAPKSHGSQHNSQWQGYESHLIKGLKPIFWGVGIILFFLSTELVDGPWFLGFIPLLVGAYYVTKSHLIQKEKEKNPPVVVDSSKTDAQKPETK